MRLLKSIFALSYSRDQFFRFHERSSTDDASQFTSQLSLDICSYDTLVVVGYPEASGFVKIRTKEVINLRALVNENSRHL